jgi:hypothetical protein
MRLFALSIGSSLEVNMSHNAPIETLLDPDETLVPDARAGVSPSEMVDNKLVAALGGVAGPTLHRRFPNRGEHRGLGQQVTGKEGHG